MKLIPVIEYSISFAKSTTDAIILRFFKLPHNAEIALILTSTALLSTANKLAASNAPKIPPPTPMITFNPVASFAAPFTNVLLNL